MANVEQAELTVVVAAPAADHATWLGAVARGLWRLVRSLWIPVVVIALWWVASDSSRSVYYPPLHAILSTLWSGLIHGPLLSDLFYSLKNLVLGLLIATVCGVAVGFVLGMARPLADAVDPLLQLLRAVPQVAMIPVILTIMGIGSAPKIISVAIATVWPVMLNTESGVRGIEPGFTDVARTFRISLRDRLQHVIVPASLPSIAAGVRTAIPIGLIVMIFSELYGSTQGVGYYILNAGQQFLVSEAWAGTLLVGIIGYAVSRLAVVSERRVLRWYFEWLGTEERG
jgi:sulfonate transport system permease protein